MFKDYEYKDFDGDHFPDMRLGSEGYCYVDMSVVLKHENSTITDSSWATSDDTGLGLWAINPDGNTARLVLYANKTGVYTITGTIATLNGLVPYNLQIEKRVKIVD